MMRLNESHHLLLTPSARELVAVIGLQPTLALVEQLGGTTFPVSRNRLADGQRRHATLVGIVGTQAAEILSKHYINNELYIPRCVAALRAIRDQQLRTDFDQLCRVSSARSAVVQLAMRYRLSDRQVWRILGQCDPVPVSTPVRQGELFT